MNKIGLFLIAFMIHGACHSSHEETLLKEKVWSNVLHYSTGSFDLETSYEGEELHSAVGRLNYLLLDCLGRRYKGFIDRGLNSVTKSAFSYEHDRFKEERESVRRRVAERTHLREEEGDLIADISSVIRREVLVDEEVLNTVLGRYMLESDPSLKDYIDCKSDDKPFLANGDFWRSMNKILDTSIHCIIDTCGGIDDLKEQCPGCWQQFVACLGFKIVPDEEAYTVEEVTTSSSSGSSGGASGCG